MLCGICGTIESRVCSPPVSTGCPAPTGADTVDAGQGAVLRRWVPNSSVSRYSAAVVVTVATFAIALVVMYAVKALGVLRVSREHRARGHRHHEHGAPAYHPEFAYMGHSRDPERASRGGVADADTACRRSVDQRRANEESDHMYLVTAIIKPHRLEAVTEALKDVGRHRYDDLRRAGLRAPTWTHRGVPRLGVQRRLPAEGDGARRCATRPRPTRSPTSSPTRPAPARSVTGRSGSPRSHVRSGSAPGRPETTRSSEGGSPDGRGQRCPRPFGPTWAPALSG